MNETDKINSIVVLGDRINPVVIIQWNDETIAYNCSIGFIGKTIEPELKFIKSVDLWHRFVTYVWDHRQDARYIFPMTRYLSPKPDTDIHESIVEASDFISHLEGDLNGYSPLRCVRNYGKKTHSELQKYIPVLKNILSDMQREQLKKAINR